MSRRRKLRRRAIAALGVFAVFAAATGWAFSVTLGERAGIDIGWYSLFSGAMGMSWMYNLTRRKD